MRKTSAVLLTALIFLLVLNIGCNPKRNPTTPDITPVIPGISTPVATNTAVVGCVLPDLTITGMTATYSNVTRGCVDNYDHPGYIVYLKNQGCVTVTGAVSINVNGVVISYSYNGGLAPGETENVWVENTPPSGFSMSAIVDPSDVIAETDESNNSFQALVPPLTPLPICTVQTSVTHTVTITVTPTKTLTVPPTPTPTGSRTVTTTGGPDLIVLSVITQLQFPHSCLSGDEGNVGTRVVIKNIGDADAVGFVDIYMSGHGTQQVTGAIPSGAERTVFFSGTSWPGNSVIAVDSTSNIAEANENNNVFNSPVAICTPPPTCVISFTATATQTVSTGCTLPDFTITGMAQGFSGVTLGCVEDYAHPGFIVYLKNQGCVTVTGAVQLNVNGVIINYAYNGGLAPGETENVWVENAPASGSMMSAIVDPSNNIIESNEINNSFQNYVLTLTPPPTCIQSATITPTITLTLPPTPTPTGSRTTGGPDLIVLSVITQLQFPHSCLSGDEGNVGTRVVIKNIGDADAVGFVDIYMSGHGTQQVTGAIPSGAERTVFFSGTSWPGNSVIAVDSTSNIAEANENNNVFNSPVAICTPPPACTNTPDVTNTVTTTTTISPTITMTPTITPAVACLTAKIKANNKYNELYTNINFTGSCVAANLQYKIAIYDGANNLITTKTAYSGYGGVLTYNYTSNGSNNISAPWHVAIMLPSYNPPAVYNASDADFEDIYEFTVMVSAPAPTPTLPCTNMVGVYHGQLTLIKYFDYKLNDCNAFTVKVNYCTENTRIALYDAGNNLLKTELLTCQTPGMSGLQMFYHIAGTEVPGIWHIDLYGESDTVPLVRTGAGTISSCPEGSLVVE